MKVEIAAPTLSSTHTLLPLGEPTSEVITVSYVNPALRDRFENLPINLKNYILEKGVQLNTLQDLVTVLEEIVAKGE